MVNISRNKEPVVHYKYVDCLKETKIFAYLTGQEIFKLGPNMSVSILSNLKTRSELFLC